MCHGETMAMLFAICTVHCSSWLYVAANACSANCALYVGLSLCGFTWDTFSLGLTLALGLTLGKGLDLV